jgi:hypothetical protein
MCRLTTNGIHHALNKECGVPSVELGGPRGCAAQVCSPVIPIAGSYFTWVVMHIYIYIAYYVLAYLRLYKPLRLAALTVWLASQVATNDDKHIMLLLLYVICYMLYVIVCLSSAVATCDADHTVRTATWHGAVWKIDVFKEM